jgi:anaerobic selenocysteine-containing dehydrogenase
MAHGIPHARPTIKKIAADPNRTLIVIDPRRTETAQLADTHLQVRPGFDAHLLAAMLATLVQEDLIDHGFLDDHAENHQAVIAALSTIDPDDYATRADVDPDLARQAARRIGTAESVSILEDLGIQQAPHSTLNSYLEKLLWALTGNFARPGCTSLHTTFSPTGLVGRNRESKRRTPVTGERIIGGMFPAAAIPDAVLTDDPGRFRGTIIESSNPVHSLPDSPRMRAAIEALDFSVVIDIAMTETARCASYVLPAQTQYEKWECTFFNLEFPENVFHLRAPVLDPPEGPLPEPEIHSRIVRALGALTDEDLEGLHEAAHQGLDAYATTFGQRLTERPHLVGVATAVLYETLGPTLPDRANSAAALWGVSQLCAANFPDSLQRAGINDGNELFHKVLIERHGFVFTLDTPDENWTWIRRARPSGRLDLAIPELLDELSTLADETYEPDPEYPFVLSAGERRRYTANTIMRDASWRKVDADGALRISASDAEDLNLTDGALVTVTTPRASATTTIEISPDMRPGHISLPNGYGLSRDPDAPTTGVPPNELTSGARRDLIAGTPWHKHVPAHVAKIAS